MINVNGKSYNWSEELSIPDLLKEMGYRVKSPAVLVTVNGTVIRKNDWDSFIIPENGEISVLNLLRGG